jgi:hypothetical protein
MTNNGNGTTESNRLPILAAEIRCAHADVHDAAKSAAQRAIDAGHALNEAKELLAHGQWLPWLREHCALAERTAQLYMKIAKSGLESATVADLGLKGAAEAIALHIDYWSDLNDAELVEWRIFALFLSRYCGWHVQGAFEHTEWLRRGEIKTPNEWLFGEIGGRFRAVHHGTSLSPGFLDAWNVFLAANRERKSGDVETEMQRLVVEQGDPVVPPAKMRKRFRRPRSDPKYTAALRRSLKGSTAA